MTGQPSASMNTVINQFPPPEQIESLSVMSLKSDATNNAPGADSFLACQNTGSCAIDELHCLFMALLYFRGGAFLKHSCPSESSLI